MAADSAVSRRTYGLEKRDMDALTEAPLIPWRDYLSPAGAGEWYRDSHARNLRAFARQREILRRVIRATRPRSIACLGAGALHDIPYRMLVRDGVEIHLADWQGEAMEAGLAKAMMRARTDGPPACLYCALNDGAARGYCRRFRPPRDAARTRCASFAPDADDSGRCAAFARGEQPRLHAEDVTAGYAGAFAKSVAEVLGQARSWRQALSQARALARRARKQIEPLGIPDAGIDLVTSAMVLSQFEHEPYDYFSRQAKRLLGAPRPGEESRLRASMEMLRDELLMRQIERHCDEILRILKPGGRCFMSFEMFHYNPQAGRWFLVSQMHRALGMIAARFRFDFDILGESGGVALFETGDRLSMVHCFVLERETN